MSKAENKSADLLHFDMCEPTLTYPLRSASITMMEHPACGAAREISLVCIATPHPLTQICPKAIRHRRLRVAHLLRRFLRVECIYDNQWSHRQLPLPGAKDSGVLMYLPCRTLKLRVLIQGTPQRSPMPPRMSFKTWTARKWLQYVAEFISNCSAFCSDVLPQIPIGGFSRVMDALNRENAEKVSCCCMLPFVSLMGRAVSGDENGRLGLVDEVCT
jgi:hypothetical protein